MNDESSVEFIKTSDFGLASALYCLGFSIDGIDKANRKRVLFYFKRTSQVEVAAKQYFENKLLVNPLEFDRSQRELKAQIHTDL